MKTMTLTAVAVILAALPVAGFAQGAPMRPAMPQIDFATADADSSGAISPEEWSTYARGLAATMRTDALAARADAVIAAGDANGDGALTRDELIAGLTAAGAERRDRMAARHDDDRGGRRGWHDERHEMRGDRMRDHDRGERMGRGERGDRAERMGRGDRMEPGDRAERMAERSFARIDLDRNGQIEAEELALAQQVMARRMQGRAAN